MTVLRSACCVGVVVGIFAGPNSAAADEGYGTIKGKFVLKGAVPKVEYLIKDKKLTSSGAEPKNANVCAARDLKSDALVIDAKHKGIGNIFIYLRKKPREIHPKLAKVPTAKLEFDQKGCRFVPHAMFVRAGQTVLMKSKDACTHNTHTYPFNNEGHNFSMAPNFDKGVPLKLELPEPLPMKVGCDIHSWMNAYWLILDHPYGAVTVAEPDAKKKQDGSVVGTFEIRNLPYGKYTFRVWHEKAGYINVNTRRGLKVTVDKPVVDLKTMPVPVKVFK